MLNLVDVEVVGDQVGDQERKVVAPSVHLNGSGVGLRNDYREAARQLRAGLDALCYVRPHGRDYYVQDDPYVGPYGPAYARAAEEHDERVRSLRQIIADIEAIGISVK